MAIRAEAQEPIPGLSAAFGQDELAYLGYNLVAGAQRLVGEGLEPDEGESPAFQEEFRRLAEEDSELRESLDELLLTAPALHKAAIATNQAYQRALDVKDRIKRQAQAADTSETNPVASEIDYGPVRSLPGSGADIRPSKFG